MKLQASSNLFRSSAMFDSVEVVKAKSHAHECSICREPFECKSTACALVSKYAVCGHPLCVEVWNSVSEEEGPR